MNWIEALKQWNASRGGRYTIPKKGSPEHAEVKELMQGSGKASGYVKLLYAKNVLGRKLEDYNPADVKDYREKQSDTRFRVGKISNKSSTLVRQVGSKKEKAAFAAEPLSYINSAELVFFAGGDQGRYLDIWANTPVQTAVQNKIDSGITIGGTSAGLAIMGTRVYTYVKETS